MAVSVQNSASTMLVRPATLIVVNPSGNRTRLVLTPLPFTIGRQGDNHLVLRDNRASRNHARILCENGEYYVEDLKSSHGVFVNGTRTKRQRLYAADRIEFGFPDSYSLIFTFDDDEIQKLLDQFSAPKSASAGAGNLAKLRALVEVARALQNSLSTDDVLSAVVDAALAITGFERGFLLLNNEGALRVQLARDRQGGQVAKTEIPVPLNKIQAALHQRSELLSMNLYPGAEFGSAGESDAERSIVGVPLVRVRTGSAEETCVITSRSDTIGLIYLDSRQSAVDLSSGNRELLQTLALEASTILENARLLEEERIKQRMEEELSIAREIQTSLLPKRLPSEGWFRVAGSSLPSHEVGGDCFDVRQLSPSVWSFVVTDVSGKGVSSALLAALLQGSFLLASDSETDIQQMMSRINLFLNERTEGEKYATVFYCTVNRDGFARWANAGHCTPFLVRASGEIEKLDTTGMPIGMLADATFGVRSLQLRPQDKIVAYSDGLSDAENAQGKFFGTALMRDTIRAHSKDSAAELLNALMRAVDVFTSGAVQHDDITAVVVEYQP